MIVPTVTIRADNAKGRKIINEADFDPAVHKLFSEDAPEEPSIPTRESIAAMGKAEVREWLEAHGAEVPKGRSVAQMRDDLARVMFVDADR